MSTSPTSRTPRHTGTCKADQQIRDTDNLCGHSVHAMYHLAAVQELAAHTSDPTLDRAVDQLFDLMVECHMYVHGAIGAIHEWEGFGGSHELPLNGYAETCASLGILFLGQRMLSRQLSGRVARAMEKGAVQQRARWGVARRNRVPIRSVSFNRSHEAPLLVSRCAAAGRT